MFQNWTKNKWKEKMFQHFPKITENFCLGWLLQQILAKSENVTIVFFFSTLMCFSIPFSFFFLMGFFWLCCSKVMRCWCLCTRTSRMELMFPILLEALLKSAQKKTRSSSTISFVTFPKGRTPPVKRSIFVWVCTIFLMLSRRWRHFYGLLHV